MARHVVAAASDFPPGERRLVRIGDRDIAVFNVAGSYYAILNRCPHQGGSLCEGRLTGLVTASRPGQYAFGRAGEMLRCPWHGWEFDLRTGQSFCEPGRVRTRVYPAALAQGRELAAGRFAAEVFPVEVERDYVVVEA